MKRPDKRYLPSAVLTAVCLMCFLLPSQGIGYGEPWWHCLTYHFHHANIWHLAGNLYALWLLRPRWSTLAVSLAVASCCALLPLCWGHTVTVGLSAVLFSVAARVYADRKASLWMFVAINLLTGLLPQVNLSIHLTVFFTAYLIWSFCPSPRKTSC